MMQYPTGHKTQNKQLLQHEKFGKWAKKAVSYSGMLVNEVGKELSALDIHTK